MKKYILLLVASLFFSVFCNTCVGIESAGSPSANIVSFGISEYVILEINNLNQDIGNVNPVDSPFEYISITSLNVKSNMQNSWLLQTYASGDLESTVVAGETIPLAQLKFRGGDVSSYTSFTTSPTTLKTGPTGTDNVLVDYELTVTFDDAAVDNYQTLITYELIAD